MQSPDSGREAGLIDLTALSLDDLHALDDSVVANALRELRDRRCGGADYGERFSDGFGSGL
jgi:FXSXX-COOH protein